MTDQNQNQLAVFGTREAIREMAERITKMMPGTVRLTATEALTVAQIAVAHGLDPFNGEVWGLKGENDKWYGVMIGIKGLRKSARAAAAAEGASYWTEVKRVEPKAYGAVETAIVYECKVRDSASMTAYGKSLLTLTQAGIPYKDAIEMIGPAPVWTGVGIATAEERSKLAIHARAMKRAEAAAIRQRYDVSFVGAAYVEGQEDAPDAPAPIADDTVEGEIVQQPEAQPAAPTTRDQATARQETLLSELGY
jgi:hypothetical protein